MSRFIKAFVACLLVCVMALPTHVYAGGYYRNSYCAPALAQVVYRDRYIYTPQIQQYVAVPVQPYYASWNAMYGAVPSYGAAPPQLTDAGQQLARQQQMQQQQLTANTTSPPQSPYLTREEFLAAMQDIAAAMREGGGGGGAPVTPGVAPKIVALVRAKCSSCHSIEDPKGKWLDTGEPVVLWNRDRLADNINWDRVGIVTLIGKMPKDDKLTQAEINDFIHHTATFGGGRGPAAQGTDTGGPPPAPTGEGTGGADPGAAPPAAPPNPEHNY